MSGDRERTTSFIVLCAAVAAGGCGADEITSRGRQTDGGSGAAGAAGNGAGATPGDASNGGAGAGGRAGAPNAGAGGAVSAGGTGAAGGTSSAGGDAGTDAPAPRCNDCWLLDDHVAWDISAMLYADGQRVVWQTGRDSYDPIGTMDVDGSNLQSFTLTGTGCMVRWYTPIIYSGYVYFNNILRVPVTFGPGSSCETVFSVDTSVPAPPVATGFFIDPVGSAFWEDIYEHDVHRLVRVDLSNFRVRDESNPNAIIVEAADASSLYGYDNPALGSSSYRLLRYDRTSKTNTVLSTYVAVPHVLSVDSTSLYFESDGGLYKVPKDATVETTPTRIPGPDGEWKILLDGSDVVYFKYEDSFFYRMPLAGGVVKTFSTGAFMVRGVTWDSTRYFVMLSEPNNTIDFRLVRIPK